MKCELQPSAIVIGTWCGTVRTQVNPFGSRKDPHAVRYRVSIHSGAQNSAASTSGPSDKAVRAISTAKHVLVMQVITRNRQGTCLISISSDSSHTLHRKKWQNMRQSCGAMSAATPEWRKWVRPPSGLTRNCTLGMHVRPAAPDQTDVRARLAWSLLLHLVR
jgi:hypothetical protein